VFGCDEGYGVYHPKTGYYLYLNVLFLGYAACGVGWADVVKMISAPIPIKPLLSLRKPIQHPLNTSV
jgi:hypothetical protein